MISHSENYLIIVKTAVFEYILSTKLYFTYKRYQNWDSNNAQYQKCSSQLVKVVLSQDKCLILLVIISYQYHRADL